jgi:alpha-amylase/alpha-mannosidase (GH57 family)
MPVSLLLGVHAHQPAGNFPEVLEHAHERCYRPFLHTLHRYPQFRFAAHFSGWLLQYLFDRHPADLALLREMVARGQAQLFGGGDLEPVLASIPTRDRIGQVRALSDRLERLVGQRPRGAWLTERVWDSAVVPALVDAGIEYVTVDDYHFLCTGMTAEQLTRYCTTEEDGRTLDLFPIAEALRYRIPFAPAPQAVAYIEQLAGRGETTAAVYFDDIEKFGIWPETYAWVYEKGWLQAFIEGVLASPAIRTAHFDEFRRAAPTQGVVYLPTTSYIEMNEWTLPAERAHAYASLVEQERAQQRYERDKAFVRGGIWKNFLSRYSEANWMHKRMLALSARLDALPAEQRTGAMRDALYRAQANDAYWHGLFGGLYLPHLRRAVYNAMLELESALDAVSPRPAREQRDADLDGAQEVFLGNGIVQAVVRCDADAAVVELDSYSLRQNFADSLRRREEHYYRKMQHGGEQHAPHGGIASAHDRVNFKHRVQPQDLTPDPRPRALFLDGWTAGGERSPPAYAPAAQQPQAAAAAFEAECAGARIGKRVEVADNRLTVRYDIVAQHAGTFDTELNLAMPSCDGFLGRYVYEGGVPGGFGQPLELPSITTLALEDGVLGGTIELLCGTPAQLDARPHYTVSQSEDGFEKIMQSATLGLRWALPAGASAIVVALEIRRK